jgi:hypothetical protein
MRGSVRQDDISSRRGLAFYVEVAVGSRKRERDCWMSVALLGEFSPKNMSIESLIVCIPTLCSLSGAVLLLFSVLCPKESST